MNTALNMMVEIGLDHPDDFLKIKETLTRIGVSSEQEQRLYPSVVILHKQGRYYLSHFKLLFLLDGKTANISDIDMKRFKTIAYLIRSWGLCSFVNSSDIEQCKDVFNPKLVKIVPFHEKEQWTIIQKYTVGGHKP